MSGTARVNVGEKAPDFTLPDTERKPRRLGEFLGKKLVLAFFPGAFTSTCTKEMCTFRDSGNAKRIEGSGCRGQRQ